MSDQPIKMYGASWCGDCTRSKMILDKHNIEYEYIDIDNNKEAIEFVEKINNGNRSIPVIVFPDNSTLTEPSSSELLNKLDIS